MDWTLGALCQLLEAQAPLSLAEPWDNAGYLLGPELSHKVERVFLSIELSEETLDEALEFGADLLLIYHLPLFAGLKRLRASQPEELLIRRLIVEGLAVYSPHTALDAAQQGMGDWLISALGSGQVRPLQPKTEAPTLGAGRACLLDQAVGLTEVVERLKQHLGLSRLRLAQAASGPQVVKSWAACPGAGGSLFEKAEHYDLLVTGEMRHHDVLARNRRGTHVVLTDHTNTERGFLKLWAARLSALAPELEFRVSERDRDPLLIL